MVDDNHLAKKRIYDRPIQYYHNAEKQTINGGNNVLLNHPSSLSLALWCVGRAKSQLPSNVVHPPPSRDAARNIDKPNK